MADIERLAMDLVQCVQGSKELQPEDRFTCLLIATIIGAALARDAQLGIPNGFQVEKERQLRYLEAVADLIRDTEPDIEGERLALEGDLEGLIEHLRRLARVAELEDEHPDAK